jgi:acyl-CoA reductase-like NAD-dependent aldehyde dehydrogenase
MATDVQISVRKIASINPATGEVLRELDCASDGEVQYAVSRARAAQPSWTALSPKKRIATLREFQRLLHRRKTDVATLITREAGKPYVEALAMEVLVVLDATRFLIENSHNFLREQPVPHRSLAMKAKSGRILREPHGLIGIISPWNYPFSIPAVEALAALVTGNAVVLKPSEYTSLVGLELASLLHAAGVPADIFQVVVGDERVGATLLDAEIDKLVFTGSAATGKRIAQAAGARLLPVLLELGGKDPMLVLDDADLDVASSAAVWGAFLNAGQTCLSVERCYVHRSLYSEFAQACVEKARKLRVGNGLDPDCEIGPMIHERQLQRVERQVEDATVKGARILLGGSRLPELGQNFYAPTVLADVSHGMSIMREETFGPVLPIASFADDKEAIRLANDSEYGLSASIWTRDPRRGEAMARHIAAGTVMVNDVISCFGISEAPHGGVKSSGIGRSHGRMGMEEMVRVKYIDSDRLSDTKKPWWFGYEESFARQMEAFVDFQFAKKLRGRLKSLPRALGMIRAKKI